MCFKQVFHETHKHWHAVSYRNLSGKLTVFLEISPWNSQRSRDCIPRQRTSFHHTLDRNSANPIQPQTLCSPPHHLSHPYVFPCIPGLTACPWRLLSERNQNDKTVSKIYFSFIVIIIIIIIIIICFFFFFFFFFFFSFYCLICNNKNTVRQYTNI
jgi:hypothetical protein